MVNMNMIVNSSDLVGYEAETKKNSKNELGNAQALNQLMKIWEGKQARSGKKVAGLGLLAVTLAACNSDDDTPFAQSDIDTAVAAVDLTTDNAAAVTAALSPHASLAAAVTSNDAAITTAALTHADGTIYATVDAAKTAGVNTTSSDAVTAALTSADGTVHATVDAAITSNDTAISTAATTAATAAAETSLMTGTGFASVSALLAAYNTASASVSAVSATLTTAADTVNGTAANDTITGTTLTYTTGDIIVDASSVDSDVMNVTATDDIAAVPTVAGIEAINFNLDAITSAGTATSFEVDTNGITSGTVTLDVTRASSTVTGVTATNVADGVTIASDLTLTSVAAEANANVTINATGTGAQSITAVSGTLDDLTIVGSGTALTLVANTAEENTTITNAGSVTITDMAAAAGAQTASLLGLTVNAGGAITVTDVSNVGSISLTTTTGDITVADSLVSTTGVFSTANGDINLADGDALATSITATATGDGTTGAATADGDIALTLASVAEIITATATGAITVGDAEAAGTLTLSAGQASTIANTVSDVETLNLSATQGMDGGTAAVTFTAADGDDGTNGAADGLVELDNINFTGSNSVTFLASMDNMLDAQNDTSNSTTAAAVIATDTMTAGTSRIEFNVTAGAALDVSKLAVDELALGFALGGSDAFTVATGQTMVVNFDQTSDIALTAPAVAGNTFTLRIDDNANAATVTGDMAGITGTNIANLTIAANDPNTTAMTTGAINVGTANTVTVTGAADVNVNGAVTAGAFNSAAHTGTMTISATNATTAFTLGSGNDTLTSAGATALSINGGAGSDTLVLAGADYSALAVSLSNIETLNVAATGGTLAGSHVTGGSYVIVGDNAGDAFGVTAQTATGETVDLSNTASTLTVVTLTGNNGADALTGSSTTSTTFIGGTGSDTLVGGSAADTFTVTLEAGAGDGITAGGGADIIQTDTTTAATISPVTVTDFNPGTIATTVDIAKMSLTALKGLTTVTDVVDTGANSAANTNNTVVILTADNQTPAAADLVVLSQVYASDAAALAGMATAGSDTFVTTALTDNDAVMVAYYTGSATHIAAAVTASSSTSSDAFDSVETVFILSGVDARATFADGDFVLIT